MNKEAMKENINMNLKYYDIDMKNFSLPVMAKFDSDYYPSLKKGLNEYNNYIQSLTQFPTELKGNVERNINLIVKSVELYYNAKFGDAKDCILNIVGNCVGNNFIISDLKDSYVFKNYKRKIDGIPFTFEDEVMPIGLYRSRISVEELHRKDMLHIPLEKRGLVSTQRFSMAGIPCIYLATSTYCCWLELNMPQRYLLYSSSIKLPDDTKVFNLALSTSFINRISVCSSDEDFSFLKQMLEVFPLVYATSYNILEQDRKFRSEYIVSQMIMQCINELGIDAVAYLSKKISDETAYPHAINIAIPVKRDFKKENSYWLKAKEVYLSEPISYGVFLDELGYNIGTNVLSDFDYSNFIDVLGNPVDFDTLKFSIFDKHLTQLEHKQFGE